MVRRPLRTDIKSKEIPASSTPEEFATWSAPPPMMPRADPLNLPFQHYATVYMDHDGNVKFSGSPSIGNGNRHFFTPEIKERFLEAAGIKPPSRIRMARRISREDGDLNSSNMNPFPSSHPRLRRRNERNSYDVDMDIGLDYSIDNDSSDSLQDRVRLEIGDSDKLLAFYETSFRALQQLNCRQIAKAFIKVIEPRKQVRHPYNGGKGLAPGEKGDPEKTKPDWWPSGVTHREPDHLKKPERIRLLIHLFRELGRSHNVTSDKLQEAGEDARRQIKPPDRLAILDEIFKVRRFEECYERGEIDGGTAIWVVKRDRSNASLNRESESPDSDQLASGRTSPMAVGTAAPLNTPVQHTNTGDRNSAFQIHYQMGLQDQMRSSQPFSSAGIKTDYDDLDSQSIAGSRTSATVTPGEQPGLDYLSHTPFAPSQTSAPEQQQHSVHHAHYPHPVPLSNPQHANGQFNPWSPQLQSNVFNSVDYAAQTMPPPQPLPQQQVQMLPNGLPQPQQTHPGHQLHGARPQPQFDAMSLGSGSPQLRNGSLSQHIEPRNGGAGHEMS